MSQTLWAEPAVQDLSDIVSYLVGESPQAASDFVDRVDKATMQLGAHPLSGRIVPELERHNISRYREVVLTPWRLFYRAEEGRVYVLAVIDGRRNVEDLLLRRLVRG